MSKQEYLRILSERLRVLQVDEYNNIMEYYTEYFEDAGADNEASVMSELGDVEALAQRIIRDNVGEGNYKDVNVNINEQREELYTNYNQPYNYNQQLYNNQNQPYGQAYGQHNAAYNQAVPPYNHPYAQPDEKGLSTGWKVAIAIITFPIWIGIVAAVFGMIFGFGAAAVGCLIGGIAAIIGGLAVIGIEFGVCALSVGAGLIVIAVALGFAMASVGLTQLVVKLVNLIFAKKKTQAYV